MFLFFFFLHFLFLFLQFFFLYLAFFFFFFFLLFQSFLHFFLFIFGQLHFGQLKVWFLIHFLLFPLIFFRNRVWVFLSRDFVYIIFSSRLPHNLISKFLFIRRCFIQRLLMIETLKLIFTWLFTIFHDLMLMFTWDSNFFIDVIFMRIYSTVRQIFHLCCGLFQAAIFNIVNSF